MYERVESIIASTLNVASDVITDGLAYQAIAEWDSMQHMRLMLALGNAFQIDIGPDEVIELNRKARNKRAVVKEGLEVSEVIVQEGVYTFETVNAAVAEPVVYMMDRFVIGGFYRVHTGRGVDENLNAPGAGFVPLAFADNHQLPRPGVKPGASAPNRFYMYGVIGRLAMLAASYELEATDPDAEIYE